LPSQRRGACQCSCGLRHPAGSSGALTQAMPGGAPGTHPGRHLRAASGAPDLVIGPIHGSSMAGTGSLSAQAGLGSRPDPSWAGAERVDAGPGELLASALRVDSLGAHCQLVPADQAAYRSALPTAIGNSASTGCHVEREASETMSGRLPQRGTWAWANWGQCLGPGTAVAAA